MQHRSDPAMTAPPSSGSSRGGRPTACRGRPVRPSTSFIPIRAPRPQVNTGWTYVSALIGRDANGERIEVGTIPGGRCAVLHVVGNTDNPEPDALYLYRDWLPASGEEARDFPLYCQRLSFFPEVPGHCGRRGVISSAEIASLDAGLSLPITGSGRPLPPIFAFKGGA
jgi:AraC family transcriptional regulator